MGMRMCAISAVESYCLHTHGRKPIDKALYSVHNIYMHVLVAIPRQDSMSAASANAVLSGYCNILVGYH